MDRTGDDFARIVAGDVEGQFVARDLVSDETVAFTDLQLAGFSPQSP